MSRYRLRLHILLISDIARRPAPAPAPTLMDFLAGPGPGETDVSGPGSCGGDPVVMRHAVMRGPVTTLTTR